MIEVITFAKGHFFNVGNTLTLNGGSKWSSLRDLLIHPRVNVIVAVTGDTLTLESRRMTWADWRTAVWMELKR